MYRQAINATVLAIVLSTVLTSWRSPAHAAEPDGSVDFLNLDGTQEFRLTVVGPEGKPVPRAEVELRMEPALDEHHVLRGEWVKARGFATVDTRADEEGRLVVVLPPKPKWFTVHIEHPGYGPYWSEWRPQDGQQEIPAEHTAELDTGWTVGGVVVDGAGKPIEGVEISVSSIKFKKRPGDLQELHVGTDVKTAADGSWKYACVPDSMKDLVVVFNHDKFMPQRPSLSRRAYEVKDGQKPAAKIELKQGLTIVGKVTDEAGQPIAGALVRTKFSNDLREARTNEDGEYRLIGCEPRTTRVVVSSNGKAMDLKEVRVGPDMEPVNFIMKPGGHLRVIALDENGKPIPKTRIFFQQWRGRIEYFEFDHVHGYADEKGVWEWNEAPHDAIVADICRPDEMQLVDQVLTARDEDYTFKPPKALVISGAVTDAETKQPVENFRVVPWLRFSNSPSVFWNRQDSYEARDGKYTVKQNREYLAHLVRIEADGYLPAASRDIKSSEGSITIDFALERGDDITLAVLTPEGKPATGAKVALGVADSHINIQNGDLGDGSASRAAVVEADKVGRVKFSPQDGNLRIVVTHPTGYAYVQASAKAVPESIELTPWGRIEGVYQLGDKPAPNATLEFNSDSIREHGQDGPSIYASHQATTGPSGEFKFERVFAGRGWLGRQIVFMVNEGATEVASSIHMPIEVVAGQTQQVKLGGDGVAVVGKLAATEGAKEEVEWQFARVHMRIEVPPIPPLPVPAAVQKDPKLGDAWFKKWQLSPEGIAWKGMREANQRLSESSPSFTATVDRDGSFRIDDVPPGNYTLNMYFDHQRPAPGRLGSHKVTVPADDGPVSEPVDLGVVQLEP